MTYIKNLGKSLLILVIMLFCLIFLISTLYYFNILNDTMYNIFKLIIPLITIFISTFLFGKKASKNGWLEGLKLGAILLFIFFILNKIFYDTKLDLRFFFYNFILLFTSVLGGMVGINKTNKKD